MLGRAALLCALAGPALAQDLGCYTRTYSAEHLAANPNQHVETLRVLFHHRDGPEAVFAAMEVRFADQGRARSEGLSGQTLRQDFICLSDLQGGVFCGVECDGGSFDILRRNSDGLLIETSYALIGEPLGCGGIIDLAEVTGEPVRYRLDAAPQSACNDLK